MISFSAIPRATIMPHSLDLQNIYEVFFFFWCSFSLFFQFQLQDRGSLKFKPHRRRRQTKLMARDINGQETSVNGYSKYWKNE